ncbi:hypothetical protein PHSY_002314 [Pseudozyma hubeiensis SY62]|uniref:Uncharacterized protein n=1 Tax=Pseudozyma hubeiensis (strain SY62) TaxID=1305764 RepID=R9P0Q3_PSEHS|nr:hypothetical protein PHSY_002314 [Pseudozyma hubeiensis SY62]GAC94741.1 hypothetical protein PHSY_002314 [Pseudozyma hubeiensis SY62]
MSIQTDTGLNRDEDLEGREIATSAGRVHLHIMHLAVFAESFNPTSDEINVAIVAYNRGRPRRRPREAGGWSEVEPEAKRRVSYNDTRKCRSSTRAGSDRTESEQRVWMGDVFKVERHGLFDQDLQQAFVSNGKDNASAWRVRNAACASILLSFQDRMAVRLRDDISQYTACHPSVSPYRPDPFPICLRQVRDAAREHLLHSSENRRVTLASSSAMLHCDRLDLLWSTPFCHEHVQFEQQSLRGTD